MQNAYGWVGVSFSEPKRINRVVVYAVDAKALPAAKYGVRELRLFYRIENTASKMSSWREAQLIGGTAKNKSLIADNRSSVIKFRVKPVTTDGIRLLVLDTNDSKQVGRTCTGAVRLVEIEAYGLEKKPRQEVAKSEDSGLKALLSE